MAPEHQLDFLSKCDFRCRRNRNRASSKKTRRRSVVLKRMARLDRPRNAVEGKVRALKKLVPNCEYVGVEGLFRETADYIMALETRVKVMQIMVHLLSGCGGE